MATRIELPKDLVKAAFKQRIDSLRRSIKEATNNLVKTALEDELKHITTATDTMTELETNVPRTR